MGIGMRELVVILLVVLLVFGAKKLRTIGSDLGAAVKGFKKSMNDGEDEELNPPRQIRSEGKDAEFADSSKTSQKSDHNAQVQGVRPLATFAGMFDIGFSPRFSLILCLALIVLGPEKLPKVASQVGRWIGRARGMARQFRDQLEEEVNLEEGRGPQSASRRHRQLSLRRHRP